MGKEQILERAEDNRKLVVFKDVNPIELLEGDNLDKMMIEITSEVNSVVYDIDTEDGRDGIKKLGAKIGKSLKFIENEALDHARKLKEAPKIFDSRRKIFKDFMNELKESKLQPLVEWEANRQRHLLMISNKVTSLMIAGVDGVLVAGVDTLEGAKAWKVSALNTVIDESFGDSQEGAIRFRDQSILIVNGLIAKYEKQAQEEAETEELRLEQEAKDKAEYEAKIKADAIEQANKAAQDAIDAEKKRSEDARIEAENDTKQREAQAIIDKENAVKAESARLKKIADDEKVAEQLRLSEVARQEEKVKAAAKKKSESQANRNKVRKAIKDAVAATGLGADAFELIKLIDEGKIPHVTINY